MIAVLFICFFVLLFLGLPIAFTLGGSSLLAIALGSEMDLAIVAQRIFSGSSGFTLMAIPFFVLAGNLMSSGGISRRLINFCNVMLGHVSGGLAMVAVVACGFFAAISGSSAATAAAIGAIIIPEMLAHRYERNFAAATVASSAELGVIIPPSIGLIMYGVAAEQSIGDLFKAGLLPGVFICVTLMAAAHFMAKKQGFEPSQKSTGKQKLAALRKAVLALFMPIMILGSIYGGLCTATEAAVLAVVYGFVVGVFVYKEIRWKALPGILLDSCLTAATVLVIIGCSNIFGWVLAKQSVPQLVANAFLSISGSKYVFLLLVNLLLLLVGMFCEAGAAMVILAPLLAPVAASLGVDLVHFGIIMMANLAVGMVTPPVGVNLYVVCDSAKVKIEGMMRYLLVFFAVLIIDLLVITFVPQLSLLLPNLLA